MTEVFSPEGLQALRAFIAHPMLCLFDFDGTLAPLVADPDAALLPAAVQAQLQALQQRAPVGIVTGRALADVRPRLGFMPDYLIGNHGLEGVPGMIDEARPVAAKGATGEAATKEGATAAAQKPASHAALLSQVARWKAALEPVLTQGDPGIVIEDKHYSLSLHYLHARNHAQAKRALRACMAALSPAPRIITGKCLFNVLPADAGDKGSAVQALLVAAGLEHALYVGDDQTDEDVFRLPIPGLFTVHVGADSDSAAQWCLHDHREVARLLDWLVAELPVARPAVRPVVRPVVRP